MGGKKYSSKQKHKTIQNILKCYTQTKYPSKNEEQRSIDREVSSLDREKVREFATSIPALQELLEEILLDDIISERYYVKDNIWQT